MPRERRRETAATGERGDGVLGATESVLEALHFAEDQRHDKNPAAVEALRNAGVPGLGWSLEDRKRYADALAVAFPVEGREGDLMDPDIASFDYAHHGEDVPIE